ETRLAARRRKITNRTGARGRFHAPVFFIFFVSLSNKKVRDRILLELNIVFLYRTIRKAVQ
ncbi:MAG: hypothetical protein J5974_02725, partial [Pyramidobacter sp.]|nr:hypothetical protein [Pyramidobacter sp.]